MSATTSEDTRVQEHQVDADESETRCNMLKLLMSCCMGGREGYERIPGQEDAPLESVDLGVRDYIRLGVDFVATAVFAQTTFAIIFDSNKHHPDNPEPDFRLVLAALTNMIAECPLAIMAVDAFIKDAMNILSWFQRIQTRGLLGLIGDGAAWFVKLYFSIMLAIHYVAAVKNLDLGPWYITMYTMMSLHLLNKIGDQVYLFFLRHKYLTMGALFNLGSIHYEDLQSGIAQLLSRLGARGGPTWLQWLKEIFFLNEQRTGPRDPILIMYRQKLAELRADIEQRFNQPVHSAIFSTVYIPQGPHDTPYIHVDGIS